MDSEGSVYKILPEKICLDKVIFLNKIGKIKLDEMSIYAGLLLLKFSDDKLIPHFYIFGKLWNQILLKIYR